jgi:hypothetical protein
MSYVPYGESWLLKSGKVVESGWHFITPFFDSVVAVKTPHPVVMGVVTDAVTSKSKYVFRFL